MHLVSAVLLVKNNAQSSTNLSDFLFNSNQLTELMNDLFFAAGSEPSRELQISPPPDSESAGQAVSDAGLQAGLFDGAGPHRATSTRPWPAAAHCANHEEWTHARCQRQ